MHATAEFKYTYIICMQMHLMRMALPKGTWRPVSTQAEDAWYDKAQARELTCDGPCKRHPVQCFTIPAISTSSCSSKQLHLMLMGLQ
jgi:hypothetical protein